MINKYKNTDRFIHLTLFFTFDISLEKWADTGLLPREILLYKELRKQKVFIQFLTYGDSTDRQWEGELEGISLLPVYERIPRPRTKIVRFLQSVFIPWYFREELRGTDLLKTNQLWGSWVAVITKFIFQKPLLIRCGYEFYDFSKKTGRSIIFRGFAFILSWFAYRSANLIHVATDSDRKIVKNDFGISYTRIAKCPNWIDTSLFAPKLCPLSQNLLFVGRLNDQKNLYLLLRALENTGIGLDVVGEGETRMALEAEANRLGLNVNFLGPLPNDQLAEIYQNHKIYIICSRFEGNPKTLLEAMACGCAVIGTDVPGIKEVICHEESGLVVKESEDSLRTAILLLWQDRHLRNNLGQRARQQVEEQNSLESAVIKELEVYQEICVSSVNIQE